MARFRGTLQGNRGEASRLGTVNGGLESDVNGWGGGVRIVATANGDKDTFTVEMTAGSNRQKSSKPIGHISVENGVVMWWPLTRGKIKL